MIDWLLRRKALALALLASLIIDIGLLIILIPNSVAADFAAFWRAARASDPYAPSLIPFGSPPTALLAIQPLRLLPLWPAYAACGLLGATAFCLTAQKLYGTRAMVMSLASPAALLTLIPGQLSLIVAASIFAACLSPPLIGGALLAVAVCLKPQMAFLAPALLLFEKRWSSLAAFVATCATLSVSATLAFGPAIWGEWREGVTMLLSVATERGALGLAVSPASFVGLEPLFMATGLIALYFFRNLEPAARAAGLVAVSLFAAPYALSYDLVALAPFAAAAVLKRESIGAALTFTASLGPISILSLAQPLRSARRGHLPRSC